MMSENDKKGFLVDLQVFVEEQRNWLQNTLTFLGWNIENFVKLIQCNETDFVSCSVIPEHRMPVESLENHAEKCEKKHGAYPKIVDVPVNVSRIAVHLKYYCGFLNTLFLNAVMFVDETSQSQNSRLAEVLSQDVHEVQEKISNDQLSGTSKCLMELLIIERDSKRRRAAHRGKRVHSNKKSYNEILREVIVSQMETLTEYTDTEIDTVKDNDTVFQKNIKLDEMNVKMYSSGVGDSYSRGNPYKRWLTIEEEEAELIKKMNKTKERENKHVSSEKYGKGSDYKSSRNDKEITRRDFKRDTKYYERYHDTYKDEHRKYNKDKHEKRDSEDYEYDLSRRYKRHHSPVRVKNKKSKRLKIKVKKKKTKKEGNRRRSSSNNSDRSNDINSTNSSNSS